MESKVMKINETIIKSIIFNIAETALILLSGLALNLEIKYIIIVMVVFMISRGFFGKSLHFKSWYRCLVWSLLTMLSIFVILKVDFIISILFAIFSAFIMTGRSDINDMYLWKNSGEPSKYEDITDFIKYHELDDRLLEFENKIKNRNSLEYLIYKYRFKDGKTFNEISELLDMDNPRIVEQLDKIAFALRLYCGI
jgi:hypothetical protein